MILQHMYNAYVLLNETPVPEKLATASKWFFKLFPKFGCVKHFVWKLESIRMIYLVKVY